MLAARVELGGGGTRGSRRSCAASTTLAPSRRALAAHSRPRPPPTPVTTTVFPLRIIPFFYLFDTDVSISKLRPVRRVAWSGQVPADEVDARRRIMAAAVRCVQRHGIDRTSVALIASEAGVSPPDPVRLLREPRRDREPGGHRRHRLVRRAGGGPRPTVHSAAERLVEATLFSVRGIRAEPALAMRFRSGQLLSGPLNHDELYYAEVCLGPVVELAPELGDWIEEASELAARVLISLLSREPMKERTEDEDRAFFYRWWPQALGVADGGPSPVAGLVVSGRRRPSRCGDRGRRVGVPPDRYGPACPARPVPRGPAAGGSVLGCDGRQVG